MAYLSQQQLEALHFCSLGRDVQISERASLYNCEYMEMGDHVRIDDFCVVSGHLKFGRNIHIAPQCLIAGGDPGIIFEDFSGLAYQAKVFAQSDDYSGCALTNPTVPSAYKKEKKAPVRLGRHVIVGAGSTIVPGVDVADGCSIGSMALVLSSTQPWGIYAGIPAKRIKDRRKDLLELEARYLAEEDKQSV